MGPQVPTTSSHSPITQGKVLCFGPWCSRAAPPQRNPSAPPLPTWSSFLLLWSLNDQVHRQPILDPVLIQSVSVLQDLPGKDQNQLILFGFKPPGNLFFELKKIKIKKTNRALVRQTAGARNGKITLRVSSVGHANGVRNREPCSTSPKKGARAGSSSVASC